MMKSFGFPAKDGHLVVLNASVTSLISRYSESEPYILQIFYRTVTYICHISVSLVRAVDAKLSRVCWKKN
jgi:hypothetical protein